jgi:glycosyltransferase involved in cell wall biosynthesis
VSLTVLEAMAAGLPVVATHVGGTPEVLTSGVTGLLVPPDSAGAIAEAVLGLLDRPDDRARLGAAARARVVHDFSLDEMVRRYLAAYRA